MVMNDCALVIADKVEETPQLSIEEAQTYFAEAEELLVETLKMLKPSENEPQYMAASRGKLCRAPNTARPNRFTELSDSMAIAGLAYILQHEFGHFIYAHEEDTPYNELQADEHAIVQLKKWGIETNSENTIFAGDNFSFDSYGVHKSKSNINVLSRYRFSNRIRSSICRHDAKR